MRQIKFRAWHKHPFKDWVMSEVISIDFIPNSINTRDGSFPNTEDDRLLKLMQFTGLLDSKGVEIYEHDLVLDKAGRRWKIEYSEKDMSFIFQYLKNESDYILYSNFSAVYHLPLEVIGNLYSNPELLEPENI